MDALNSVQALCMSAGVAYVSAPPFSGPIGGSFASWRVGESGCEGEGLRTTRISIFVCSFGELRTMQRVCVQNGL